MLGGRAERHSTGPRPSIPLPDTVTSTTSKRKVLRHFAPTGTCTSMSTCELQIYRARKSSLFSHLSWVKWQGSRRLLCSHSIASFVRKALTGIEGHLTATWSQPGDSQSLAVIGC